jgi:hypothetical protein
MLDEVVVLPLLLMLARRLVPAPIMAEIERDRARRAALAGPKQGVSWGWVVVAVLVLGGLGWWVLARQAA